MRFYLIFFGNYSNPQILDFWALKLHILSMQQEIIYPLSNGESLQVSLFRKNEAFEKNTLIFVHGFKGFKDWGFFPYSALYFADRGFNCFTFNFSHNGIGDIKDEFTRLDKFAKNTVSRDVYELKELVSGIKNGFFGKEFIGGKLGIIGHSRGGATVAALHNLVEPGFSAAALWASVAKLNRYSERQKEEWKKAGYFEILNTRTNQVMRLNAELLYDIEENSDALLNIEKGIKNIKCPLFIAHGGQDLTVPIEEADILYGWSDKEKTELFKLPTAGHTFDVVHPFTGTNEKLERLLENTYRFFKNNMD